MRQQTSTEDASDEGKKKRFRRSKMACQYCRHLKMKCSGSVPCDRCLRIGRQCEESNRPKRGSWSRKKDSEIQFLTRRLEEMENKLEGNTTSTSQATNLTQENLWQIPQEVSLVSGSSNSFLIQASQQDDPFDTSTLSLPFVKTGLITSEEAKDLFKIFMHNCLQHVPLLDAEWHSFEQVTTTCPFLSACIINVAANYYTSRPTIRSEMQEEMNTIIGNMITSGKKSVGIIQGFLVLYFWNQPSFNLDLDLAWTYSGLAMRMAVDLNLSSGSKVQESERERINRERTWMFCFLVDRTQSAARGKKWSLHGNDHLVGNSRTWYSQDICRPWDLGIAALADLMKLTSRQTDVLNDCLLTTTSELGNGTFQCDTTMRVLNNELQQWKQQWYARGFFTSPLGESVQLDSPMRSNSDSVDVHSRTLHYITRQAYLRFYYAVLVLNCAGLQYYASHPESSEGRTYNLMHAMQAAQGIVTAAMDGLRYTVAYSPHTQCTITSFAIISLIKMAPLMRDDPITSDRLIQLAVSGTTFLDSVALHPTHVPARCASMLRGLLRKSNNNNNQAEGTAATSRPGMEDHSLPIRSSRAVTPSHGLLQTSAYPSTDNHKNTNDTTNFNIVGGRNNNNEDMEIISNNTPTSFTLFGTDGSTGFGQMTADQILDESFWLCLPLVSPSAPWG